MAFLVVASLRDNEGGYIFHSDNCWPYHVSTLKDMTTDMPARAPVNFSSNSNGCKPGTSGGWLCRLACRLRATRPRSQKHGSKAHVRFEDCEEGVCDCD